MKRNIIRALILTSLLSLPVSGVFAAKAQNQPLTLDERAAVGYYRSGSETAAVKAEHNRLYFLYPASAEDTDPDLWNWYYLDPQRGSSYEMAEIGPMTKAVSSLTLKKEQGNVPKSLELNRRTYQAFVSDSLPSLIDNALGSEPDEMARDEEALIGFYRSGGVICAVREEKGELQLVCPHLSSDRDMTKSNIYAMPKVHYDSYELKEKGPNTDNTSEVRFNRDRSGWGISLNIGNYSLSRIFTRGETGKPRRIKPASPLKDLREAAAKEVPPNLPYEKTAELVDITSVVPGVHLDLRYTTANNLFGEPLVVSKKAYLDRTAAAALGRVQQKLKSYGYGLVIWEGYRSWTDFDAASKALGPAHAGMLPAPAEGYSHNSGRSVDVSLYDLESGENISMISDFDEISPAQYAAFPGGTQLNRWRRDLLRSLMTAEGFTASDDEWWHFDFDKAHSYKVLNETMS
jgi:D-alanyl-D-alanine dipeptidase